MGMVRVSFLLPGPQAQHRGGAGGGEGGGCLPCKLSSTADLGSRLEGES